jgi:peptidoglycan/LPS O-acetylase OafA/YrhL
MAEQQVHLSHLKYRPDIDGLRAVAVLAVVAFHAFPSWVTAGFIGVDIFFVISGYLISTIIFENLDGGTFSFSEFYARRIKRIFPALILVLITCFAFGWFALLADEYKLLGKHIAAGAGFISNFALLNEAGYFDKSADTKPLLHLWSLGIEEQFYIVWPLLLWLAWKCKFNLLIITIIFAISSFIFNIKGIEQDMVATFYSPQTRFWELLSGSLLAWVTLYKKDAFSNVKHKIDFCLSRIFYREKYEVDGKTLSNALSFSGALLLLYGFWRIDQEIIFPGKWALVPVLGAVLIITAGSKAWINRVILSNKVAVWFGLISFPLYLWHWPLLSFARIVLSESPSIDIRIAIVVISTILAWLTYRFVERPLRFGKNGRAGVAILVVLMAAVGCAGYTTFKQSGLIFRAVNLLNSN